MNLTPPELQKQIDKDSWSEDHWWNRGQAKKAVLFGLLAGFIGWLILYGYGRKLLSTPEHWDLIFPYDLILCLLAGPIAVYIKFYRGAKRRLEVEQWCQRHGWKFAADRSQAVIGFYRGSQTPGILSRRSDPTSNLMWHKVDDRTVVVGHIPLWDGRTEGEQDDHKLISCAFLSMEIDNPAPDVIVHHHATHFKRTSREPKLSKVEFELPEFNQRWKVLSGDPKGAYDLFDQATMECLMNINDKMYIEFKGKRLDFFLVGSSDTAAREKLIGIAEQFSQAVPDDLLKPIKILSV